MFCFPCQGLYESEQALSQSLPEYKGLDELADLADLSLEKELAAMTTGVATVTTEISCDLMPASDVDQLSIEIEKER